MFIKMLKIVKKINLLFCENVWVPRKKKEEIFK